MAKPMIQKDKDFKNIEKLIIDWDKRTTYFFREFVAHMADVYMEQLVDRIPSDARTEKYKESFRVWISTHMASKIKDKQDDNRKIQKVQEYWSGIEAVQAIKTFNQLNVERTLIRVKKGRGTRPALTDMLLFRYQPWTLDTIPWVPRSEDVYLVYEEIGLKQFFQEKIGIRKRLPKALDRAKKDGIKAYPESYIIKKLEAVHNLVDIALKMEFGLFVINKAHWRPALKFIEKTAWKKALSRRKDLDKVLFDYKFTKFKKPWSGRQKIDVKTMADFEYFSNKITGREGIK